MKNKASAIKTVNLRTEYMKDPLGIDILHPRLSWNDEGLIRQSAYEIEFDINGRKSSTGRIVSDQMYHDMKEELHSRDHVVWKVRVYDENGNADEYSEAYFEMGLLEKSDFKGKWISGNYRVDKRQRYPVDCFRKVFEAENISKARLYASALGLYEIEINGKRAGDFVLAPGFTDYHKRVQYQTYDVTNLLNMGENIITARLADGWYRGSIGAKGRRNTYGIQTKLYLQLEITDNEGNIRTIISDESFDWSNDGEIRFADLKDGEVCDARMAPTYKGKALVCRKDGPLKASNNTFVKEHEHFNPAEVIRTSTGKITYDFRQNIAGYVCFKAKGNAGDKINLVMGELLDENNEVDLTNVQCIHKGKKTPLQEVHYICKDGINEYKGSFFFAGFRYVTVSSDAELESIESIALYSDMEETSSFICSNELINTLYKNTLWSLKGNSIDIPTDCPTRERMGWTGDSQVFFKTAAYLMNYAPFARKHINDLFDRQWKNGKLAQIVPFSNEDWFMWTMNGSVGWADAGVLIPYRYYQMYGDRRLLEDNFEGIMKYADFMISRAGKWGGVYSRPLGINRKYRRYAVNKGQSYGEWAEPNDVKAFVWYDFASPHPEESTAYTSWILKIVIKICEILGKTENINRLRQYSDGAKKAYQEMVKTNRFTLDTDRQAKQVRPLYMKLLDEKHDTYARKRLIKAIDNYGWRLGTGFLSTPFILDVLSDIDPEYAYRLLENEEMPGWLYMAKNNTGTIWEGWEGPNSQEGIASLNHYSKGAVVEWLFRGMCGINIESENRFLIKPIVGGKETQAQAVYDSVYGRVSSGWKKTESGYRFEIEIPANCSAKIILPDGKTYQQDSGTADYEIKR